VCVRVRTEECNQARKDEREQGKFARTNYCQFTFQTRALTKVDGPHVLLFLLNRIWGIARRRRSIARQWKEKEHCKEVTCCEFSGEKGKGMLCSSILIAQLIELFNEMLI